MENITTISLEKETKSKLDRIKLCNDESYNSLLIRLIKMMDTIGNKEILRELKRIYAETILVYQTCNLSNTFVPDRLREIINQLEGG